MPNCSIINLNLYNKKNFQDKITNIINQILNKHPLTYFNSLLQKKENKYRNL